MRKLQVKVLSPTIEALFYDEIIINVQPRQVMTEEDEEERIEQQLNMLTEQKREVKEIPDDYYPGY